MKSLLINTFDSLGGASRATYRLLKGLQRAGVDSEMLVQVKNSDDASIIGPQSNISKFNGQMRLILNSKPVRLLYPNNNGLYFSPALLPDRLTRMVTEINPDIIHLHWVGGGFFHIDSLRKFTKPVIWTLHDSWAFTGGCHIPLQCTRYENSCGMCPALGSHNEHDLSSFVLKRKLRSWKNVGLTIVTPSTWLKQCVQASALFRNVRVEVIPNGLDLQVYKPLSKTVARQILTLPQGKKIILFGAIKSTSDKNKGLHFLEKAIYLMKERLKRDSVEIIIFGSSAPKRSPDFGFNTRYMGYLHDDISLAVLYAAADVMIVPSMQESFGQTASESLACGTPVVAFNTSGLKDIVDHRINGYLCEPFDVNDLLNGILWILEDNQRIDTMSRHAREKVEKLYGLEVVTNQYIQLYSEMIAH